MYDTPIDALNASIQLWEHILNDDVRTKLQAYKNLNMSTLDLHLCPLCEFSKDEGIQNCELCPAKKQWLNHLIATPKYSKCRDVYCEGSHSSPWERWRVSVYEPISVIEEAACDMLKLLNEARDELLNGEQNG